MSVDGEQPGPPAPAPPPAQPPSRASVPDGAPPRSAAVSALLVLAPIVAIAAGVLLLAPAVGGGLGRLEREARNALSRGWPTRAPPLPRAAEKADKPLTNPMPPLSTIKPPAKPPAPPSPYTSAPAYPSASPAAPAPRPAAPTVPGSVPAPPSDRMAAAPASPPAPPPKPATPATFDAAAGLAMATPASAWKSTLSIFNIQRIAFGSCLDQRKPQPIWRAVSAMRPQLFLMMGDNVYGDATGPDLRELAIAYRDQLANPDFAAARAAFPFLATWDDHDIGVDDASAATTSVRAEQLFRAFWRRPAEDGHARGVQLSRTFGVLGNRVQIILLDTRSFRSPFTPKGADFPHWGKYGADDDASKTMLGEAQWRWLEGELRTRADIRIIVSSVQVIGEGHGFERWGALPREKERLFRLIAETGATGVVLLSGDRHAGAIYNRAVGRSQIVPEVTSSSLNAPKGPMQDARTAELVSELHGVENFGLVDIDWDARRVTLALHGLDGRMLDTLTLKFADLGMPPR